MSLRPWLSGFRARLSNSSNRRKACRDKTRCVRTLQAVQRLEERTLLTATALVIGTELTVLTDADETVTVGVNSTTGNTEVLIDNVVLAAGSTVPAGSLTSLLIQTGSASNQIDLSAITSGVFTSLASITVDAGEGDDTIIGAASVSSALSGGDGNDVITGGTADDVLMGNDGQDTINGGAGNDDINAGDGDDSVLAGAGDDTVTGDDGDDTVFGGDGNDSIIANNGADSLFGEGGDDTLNGDGGFDSIDGGAGNDLVFRRTGQRHDQRPGRRRFHRWRHWQRFALGGFRKRYHRWR
jgi:Ca2+-binding RTX toxin-like protein